MSETGGTSRFAIQPSLLAQLRRALRVVAGSNISRMAAALSYRTVFGLIPMIAIGVAVLGGFASDEQVTDAVERVLDLTGLNEIVVKSESDGTPTVPGELGAAGVTQPPTALDDWLKSLVAKVRGVSFVAISVGGLFILAYAAISFMVEIERSANHIYRAPTGRSWVRRVTQYWTTLTLGSIFLVGTFYVGDQAQDVLARWASIGQKQQQPGGASAETPPASDEGGEAPRTPPAGDGGAAAGDSTPGGTGDPKDKKDEKTTPGAIAAGKLVSVFIDFFLLFFVYTTVPNARVNMRCAAIGAILAAVFWEAGKSGFQIFAANSSTETLYGAIALVPLFLLWVYITWIIVLSGLQISYVLQHFQTFAVADDEHRGPVLVDPLTLVRVAVEVARRFAVGEKAGVADIAKAVGLDEKTSLTMLERLTDATVLNRVPVGQEREVFALARPAEEVSAIELIDLAGRMAESGRVEGEGGRLAALRRAQREAAAGMSLADLMGERPAAPAAASAPAETGTPSATAGLG
ncbi:MAG: YihY/virulence factor BrkB family protein [Phycisphaerales bacterium]|nr:YihY/virulence factor BrkB family protein [Phycisphaerales bacterium]